MLNLVIFGAPGSGKGTQSERLIDRYGLYHISTGELLRDHIARGTELGKIADSYISKGNLIPDELMLQVLEKTLDDNPEETRNGVIFDGFPRTIPQAEALNKMLERHGTKLHSVVGLEVPEDELVDRLLKTRSGVGPHRRQRRHHQDPPQGLPPQHRAPAQVLRRPQRLSRRQRFRLRRQNILGHQQPHRLAQQRRSQKELTHRC